MERVFWYFLQKNIDGEELEYPIPSTEYLGTIGDQIELDGVGYTILDYAEEITGGEES